MAYLTQEVRELERVRATGASSRPSRTCAQCVRAGRQGDQRQPARASGSGSPAARQQTRVGDLSGGERRRLQLTRLLHGPSRTCCILDEPTNDLDIETLTSLEDVLDGWAGTLLVVSHDRYLLERVCDRQVALLGDGRLRDLPGGVEEYLRLRHAAAERAAVSVADAGRAAAAVELTAGGGGSGCRRRCAPAEVREARKAMARVEKQLARLAQREERLHAAMARVGDRPREGARA